MLPSWNSFSLRDSTKYSKGMLILFIFSTLFPFQICLLGTSEIFLLMALQFFVGEQRTNCLSRKRPQKISFCPLSWVPYGMFYDFNSYCIPYPEKLSSLWNCYFSRTSSQIFTLLRNYGLLQRHVTFYTMALHSAVVSAYCLYCP